MNESKYVKFYLILLMNTKSSCCVYRIKVVGFKMFNALMDRVTASHKSKQIKGKLAFTVQNITVRLIGLSKWPLDVGVLACVCA